MSWLRSESSSAPGNSESSFSSSLTSSPLALIRGLASLSNRGSPLGRLFYTQEKPQETKAAATTAMMPGDMKENKENVSAHPNSAQVNALSSCLHLNGKQSMAVSSSDELSCQMPSSKPEQPALPPPPRQQQPEQPQPDEYRLFSAQVVGQLVDQAITQSHLASTMFRDNNDTLGSELDSSFASVAGQPEPAYQNQATLIMSDESEYESAHEQSLLKETDSVQLPPKAAKVDDLSDILASLSLTKSEQVDTPMPSTLLSRELAQEHDNSLVRLTSQLTISDQPSSTETPACSHPTVTVQYSQDERPKAEVQQDDSGLVSADEHTDLFKTDPSHSITSMDKNIGKAQVVLQQEAETVPLHLDSNGEALKISSESSYDANSSQAEIINNIDQPLASPSLSSSDAHVMPTKDSITLKLSQTVDVMEKNAASCTESQGYSFDSNNSAIDMTFGTLQSSQDNSLLFQPGAGLFTEPSLLIDLSPSFKSAQTLHCPKNSANDVEQLCNDTKDNTARSLNSSSENVNVQEKHSCPDSDIDLPKPTSPSFENDKEKLAAKIEESNMAQDFSTDVYPDNRSKPNATVVQDKTPLPPSTSGKGLQFENALLDVEALDALNLDLQAKLLEKDKALCEARQRNKNMENELKILRTEVQDLVLRDNDMVRVLREYERTISELTAERERERVCMEIEKEALIRERDQAFEDLQSLERSFSDTMKRYERIKEVISGFKQNEEILKGQARQLGSQLKTADDRYEQLRAQAKEQLRESQEKLASLQRSRDAESTRLQTLLRKAEMKVSILERTIEEKQRENRELAQICDELISKVGK